MRKLLNILTITILVTTPVITIVSCTSTKGINTNKDIYKDSEVENMPNGPLKNKLLQTSIFTKMAIINRHENLNTYSPSTLGMFNRLPDLYKDENGINVDLGYYRNRYFNSKDGMPLLKIYDNEDYMNLIDSSFYNTQNQNNRKIPFFEDNDNLPMIPNLAANNNMLNYWYDGGPLADYSRVKEILSISGSNDARLNPTIADNYKKSLYQMPRDTYFYDLNMNFNPLQTKDIKVDETNSNFIINKEQFALGGPFITAQKAQEQNKLILMLKLISMAEMFTDFSQSKTYINQLNDFLALSKDSDGSFLGSILGLIYYQNLAAPNGPSVTLAQNVVIEGLKNLTTNPKEKSNIESEIKTFFAKQSISFTDLLNSKAFVDGIDITTPEGKIMNENALYHGKTPNLRLVDLVYKADPSKSSLAELIRDFGEYVNDIYSKATALEQDNTNDAISNFLELVSHRVTPGFRIVVKSMGEMMKPISKRGLGTLTINDLNQFFGTISKDILIANKELVEVAKTDWSASVNQEENQTKIAKLLTKNMDPSKPIPGSFMDNAFTWFNDVNKPVRHFLNVIYFDKGSLTRRDLLAINQELYKYSNNLMLDSIWNISNPVFNDDNNFTYNIAYNGLGDVDVAENLDLHENWLVPKTGISTYQELNEKYLAALKNKEYDWFAKYNGLGNDYRKVNYYYNVTWTNLNPGDDENQYWVISNIQWFGKNKNGGLKRYYDAIEND